MARGKSFADKIRNVLALDYPSDKLEATPLTAGGHKTEAVFRCYDITAEADLLEAV